ncbi:MAG TPA: O-antigen ligase family protein [Thermoanaerobaculia bacterium]|nr:O-antigen ligase family protein [Thermoanaerobaculia bacterium]
MPLTQRWTATAELACLVVFFCWLIFLPLPFGSMIEESRPALIAVPLALCVIAASIRLYATRDRTNTAQPTRAWLILGNGALLLLATVALQLVPLPRGVLAWLSPESEAIWSAASRIVTFAGGTPRTNWPLTVDPQATAFELFRMAALLAAFATAAMLIRSHARRQMLAVVLCGAATFEVLYGVREAALNRYAIWGWTNRLVFNRVTGTYVNPNHYAHYLAIVLPMALFIAAVCWHRAGGRETSRSQRLVMLLESSVALTGFALLAALGCLGGVLLAQSRGALLSLAAGLLAVGAMLPGRRVARTAFAVMAGLTVIATLALFLGPERTVGRFLGSDSALGGRRIGLESAAGIYARFPLLGSGAGTFERVVSMEQTDDHGHIYHHVHNDYAEIAATTGTAGFVIAMVTLFGGYVALVRMTFGAAAQETTWSRRLYQAAALASLTIAMVHALVDFNFYIPANPATLAAIVGASVASLDHDKRTRR